MVMTHAPMALIVALGAAPSAPTGVLIHEDTPLSIVRFVPADGGPPRRIAPETGHGYGRRGGQVDIFGVHPASGTVLLLWTPRDTLFRDLFAVHADGRDADAPRLLVPGVNLYAKLAFSPDGRSVLTATRDAVVRVGVDDGPIEVLARLPEPVRPGGRLEDAPPVSLEWTPAGAMVELQARGRAPARKLIPWDACGVAFEGLPSVPFPAPQDATAGKRRFVEGSTTLVLEGPWDAPTPIGCAPMGLWARRSARPFASAWSPSRSWAAWLASTGRPWSRSPCMITGWTTSASSSRPWRGARRSGSCPGRSLASSRARGAIAGSCRFR